MTVTKSNDQFPVGMRVLAVDDDPICLRLLGNLLRKCQYHVTTTSQAVEALQMLRENKDMFDLVISDVHMPDMDGLKLLEVVGLEMDLPVIMLSANSDTKMVMKGITHGACDYLLKPVRMEELRNIWQHVLRKKKNKRQQDHDGNSKQETASTTGGSSAERSSFNPPPDHEVDAAGKSSAQKKRKKDHDEEDQDDSGEDSADDPSAQKKPRVIWSVDLHHKFVEAVEQLGLDKAVPKKILELMNVENLTRENVASHLQKYRLYLKRIGAVANQQQTNIVAALGNNTTADPSSYLGINSVSQLSRSITGNLQRPGLVPPAAAAGMFGRLNYPAAGGGLRGGIGLSATPAAGMVSYHGICLSTPAGSGPFRNQSSVPPAPNSQRCNWPPVAGVVQSSTTFLSNANYLSVAAMPQTHRSGTTGGDLINGHVSAGNINQMSSVEKGQRRPAVWEDSRSQLSAALQLPAYCDTNPSSSSSLFAEDQNPALATAHYPAAAAGSLEDVVTAARIMKPQEQESRALKSR